MKEDYGFRSAIIQAYQSAAKDAKGVNLEESKVVPASFVDNTNGLVHVSKSDIKHSLGQKFNMNPERIDHFIADMESDGILGTHEVNLPLTGRTAMYITLKDKIESSIDSLKSLFADKSNITK